ncbi:MAG: cell division protein SepF [Cyanobacteria bacterium P01_C01_bin.118]
MSTIFTKLRDFVGLNDPADYEYEYDEMDGEEYQNLYEQENHTPQPQPATGVTAAPPATPVATAEPRTPRRRIRDRVMSTDNGMVSMNNSMSNVSNVIGMPGAINGVSEVIVMEPRSFEEMPQAIQALRERKSVVLNLTIMDPDQAQRAVDFVAGGTYAMDGHQERIGESIFLFTPNCVQVSMPVDEEDSLPMEEPVMPAAAPTPAWATEQVARMA